MASRVEGERNRGDRVRGVSVRGYASDETKAAFKTTEFVAYVASVAAVLIASAIDDGIDGRLAWILVTALGIGYMLSRGSGEVGRPPPRRSRLRLTRRKPTRQ
jgi:hypothetical protein